MPVGLPSGSYDVMNSSMGQRAATAGRLGAEVSITIAEPAT